MPIDFSLLGNPQQKGGVVAQIPVNQAPNPIDAGIGGLMSGMAQGQQIQLQAAQTQEIQAKAAKEQAAARAQLEIQKAHQEGGVPAMLDAMDKYDIKTSTETRKALQEIQNGKATYDKTIAETAQTEQATKTSKALADTYPSVSGLNKANTAKAEGEASKLALANSDEFLDKNAGAFHAADNAYKQALAKDPDPVKAALAANQVLQIKQAALPKYMFDVIPVPREYSPNNLFISNLAGADAHDRLLDKQTQTNADPLAKAQGNRDRLLARQQQLQQEGKDTTKITSDLKEANDRIMSLSQGSGQNSFQHANVLRDEVNKQTIPFQQVNDAYGRILAAVKPDPKTGEVTGAGDLALIFNYMKMLDPGSTVREGEFATAQNSAGLPEILRAKYNKVMSGERLAPKTRAEFTDKAKDLYKSQEQGYEKVINNYSAIAKRNGLPVEDVVQDVRVKGRADKEQAAPSQQDIQAEMKRRGLL